ncbi:Type 2 glycerol-3-phosphate oxidase GlpO [[Mycoplasma] cavipharyngis]|uniref:type 2 glycerol-3-phosphate oxidase n=1 Tax=[Mycoplasma] cavipharyngis TaxID=92757 RepID=UPI003703A5B6
MTVKKCDVLIIGGGIIGASIFYELSKYNCSVVLLEKNPVFADETTKGNSGVIHGGFDAESQKVEAHLNVLGNSLWQKRIFPKFKFPRAKVDSLVLAFNDEEMNHAKKLLERGLTNQVNPNHLKILNRAQVLAHEPNVNPSVLGALLCTNSFIIDPVAATLELIEQAKNKNKKFFAHTNTEVTKISFNPKIKNGFSVEFNHSTTIQVKRIINAAGHYADVIAAMAHCPDFRQTTRRGEYRVLDRSQKDIVKNICFLMPTIHGKGIIVAPMLTGHILVGPTAEDNVPKDQTRITTLAKYNEISKIAHKIIPKIDMEQTIMTYAGSRPIDIATNDFVIGPSRFNPYFINAAGMQSPGISSAPAIALEIIKHLRKSKLDLVRK